MVGSESVARSALHTVSADACGYLRSEVHMTTAVWRVPATYWLYRPVGSRT
jgi:hypothetical protein